MSYASEVIADSSGQWTGNQLRFETFQEAEMYVADLSWRWTAVRQTRVIPSLDSVNYRWKDGHAVPVELVEKS